MLLHLPGRELNKEAQQPVSIDNNEGVSMQKEPQNCQGLLLRFCSGPDQLGLHISSASVL